MDNKIDIRPIIIKRIVYTLIISCIVFFGCNTSNTNDNYNYPYHKSISFDPISYVQNDAADTNGKRLTITFDVPQITKQVVANGNIEIKLFYKGSIKELPVHERVIKQGITYFEGYFDYSYQAGKLKIIGVSTTDERMTLNYFDGGPYTLTITK